MAKQKPKRKLPMPIYQINRTVRNHGLSPEQIAWDDYLIPGTETLRNNFTTRGSRGTPNPDELTFLEEQYAGLRILELGDRPIAGSFDYDHMRRIHKHLFQDVYSWAGEQRTVDMSKRGRAYADVSDIPGIWHANTKKLSAHNRFKGISDRHEFVDKLAEHWGSVNFAHAFREGNTRSQGVFYQQLADEAGWELDVARLRDNHPQSLREQFVDARFYYQDDAHNHQPLAKVLSKMIELKQSEKQIEPFGNEERRKALRQRFPDAFSDETLDAPERGPRLGE